MTEERFWATAKTEVIPTSGDTATSTSSSSEFGFYFQGAVVVIGVVGAAANALILYAMVASKQHTKQLLIFNQNVFDLSSCLLLVVTYALRLSNIRPTGTLGYWLCMTLLSQNLLWCSINGSAINLLSVTVERYLKVVHPTWSKKLLRKWVIWSAVAFAWISSTIYNTALVFTTGALIDGVCLAGFASEMTKTTHRSNGYSFALRESCRSMGAGMSVAIQTADFDHVLVTTPLSNGGLPGAQRKGQSVLDYPLRSTDFEVNSVTREVSGTRNSLTRSITASLV